MFGGAGLFKRTRSSACSSTSTTSFQPDSCALGFLPSLLKIRKLAPWIWNGWAIGIPDEKSGEVVKLYVVKKNPALTEKEVLDYCHDNLTGYKRPKMVEFRTELPKTNVGKILRRALRDEAVGKTRPTA